MASQLFHTDKAIAGIDISTTGIKVMAIDPKGMAVLGYGNVDLDPAKVQQSISKSDDFLGDALKDLLKHKLVGHIPSNQVAVSVPTSRTYSRTMAIPIEAEKGLAEAVQLEVEQYIPIAGNELNIDYEVIERGKKDLTVLVSAVPKVVVEGVLAACAKAELQPILVEPGINSAARLIKVTEEGHLPSMIMDIGAATSDIALLDGGAVRLTGSVAVGGHTFTLRISEALKVPLEEAHQLKVHSGLNVGPHQQKLKTAMETSVNQIVSEMRKIIRYYNERIGVKTKIEQIVVVGGGSNMPGLGDALTEAMIMPVRVANPWEDIHFGKLEPPRRLFKPRYITAAGLAIVNPREVWA